MTPNATTPDHTLMTLIAAGDSAAFDELHRRHGPHVRAQARELCANRELAEDVAQEAFLSLWRGAHAYRPGRGSVGAWMSTMVRNRAIDAWRRAAIRPLEVEAHDHVPGRRHDPADDGVAFADRTLVRSLIGGLPAAQKQAVFLAYYGDMSHSEIAAVADAPLGTIKGRVRLGLEKLRGGFDEQSRALRPSAAVA